MRVSRGMLCGSVLLAATAYGGQTTNCVTQYGITWTFDKECPVGRFVNGDWWVIGPVTVVSVSPRPGSVAGEGSVEQNSRYGAKALRTDSRMRNGSMVVLGPDYSAGDQTGFGKQGYDSRVTNYATDRSVQFPYTLETNRSLISTASSRNVVNGKLETPNILGQKKISLCKSTAPLALERAAVLTCLPAVPPKDAFRPPYTGTEKPIYRTSDIRWDLLPNLPALDTSPDWETMTRIFERPWIDHVASWTSMYMLPGLNGPQYGREFSRMSSIAALMLLQDTPQKIKEPLMIGYLQLGIDLAGLAQNGRQWFSDGGHWQGRKWPILFASLMLDEPALRNFPAMDLTQHPYSNVTVLSSTAVPIPVTLFQEDMDFYYGQGGDGQSSLWQIVYHTYPRPPHQETPHDQLAGAQQLLESYYVNNVGALSGAALAAQLMGARKIWNHDSFFDHLDYWMLDADWRGRPSWMPTDLEKVWDGFVEDMWDAYRDDVPEQAGGTNPVQWIWKPGSKGYWDVDSQ